MIDLVGDRKSLLIRADASAAIGAGHVMRCLALAQAWQAAGGTATFASTEMPDALRDRLQVEEIAVVPVQAEPGSEEDAAQTAQRARTRQATWIVADGYAFGATYQQALRQDRFSLLVLDDYGHADHYYADVVLNQNLGAKASLYVRREPYTRLLLGTRYALLRREFWSWRSKKHIQPAKACNVLITLGGSDPKGTTRTVMAALLRLDRENLDVRIVIGSQHLHGEELVRMAEAAPFTSGVLHDVADMPALMQWADVAVSAGGSTCWELAFMGVPNLIIVLADNQRGIAAALAGAGVSINLGWHQEVTEEAVMQALEKILDDEDSRMAMAQRGPRLVDGCGGHRVVAEGLNRETRQE